MPNKLISLVFLLIFLIINNAYTENEFILPVKKPSIFKKIEKSIKVNKSTSLPQKKPVLKITSTENTKNEKKKTEKHKPTKSKASQEEGILMATDISNYLDRITDYQLVTAHTPSALNQEVRKEMELYGWIPYGGASVAHAGMGSSLGGAGSYFQAMVKLKKK